jgi:hypothetical protein
MGDHQREGCDPWSRMPGRDSEAPSAFTHQDSSSVQSDAYAAARGNRSSPRKRLEPTPPTLPPRDRFRCLDLPSTRFSHRSPTPRAARRSGSTTTEGQRPSRPTIHTGFPRNHAPERAMKRRPAVRAIVPPSNTVYSIVRQCRAPASPAGPPAGVTAATAAPAARCCAPGSSTRSLWRSSECSPARPEPPVACHVEPLRAEGYPGSTQRVMHGRGAFRGISRAGARLTPRVVPTLPLPLLG